MLTRYGHTFNESNEGHKDSDNYLIINSCGYQKFITKSNVIHRQNGRKDYILVYVISGESEFLFKKQEKVSKGSIAVYRPGEEHLYSFSSHYNTEDYWIHFTGTGIEDLLMTLGIGKEHVLNIGIYPEYLDLFDKIISELQMKRASYHELAASYFIQFIGLVGRRHYDRNLNMVFNKYPFIKDIIYMIHNDYNTDLSITKLARQCNLDLSHFIKIFIKVTGATPLQYITNIRIQKAKHLLANTSLSITEISDLVGYNSYNYFSRMFKKITGITPSIYKESLK